MKKAEFEKVIMRLNRNIELDTLTLKIILWHGQDMTYNNGIWVETYLDDENNNTVIDETIIKSKYDDLEENEENLKALKKEQKQIATKIQKWLNPNWGIKIELLEENV